MNLSIDSNSNLANYENAYTEFLKAYPDYEETQLIDEMRQHDYARLDRLGQVYLDYTGGSLYAESQLRQHMALLNEGVFGNPHSRNPTSLLMTQLVERARDYISEFFHAPKKDYTVIFTANASGALKLVGESYPFEPGGQYLLVYDNHNSVNGIREFARAKGATVTYMPVVKPELRLDEDKLTSYLDLAHPGKNNLFAFPAQSNFSGVQHSLHMIDKAHSKGWDVILDCAAFAPTNYLDVGVWQPDFVPLSFYKIFGYPTGVGCLIARRSALERLRRPWFAGGTIKIASVQGNGHYLMEGEGGFEDGTINYLNLPAVEIGLRHVASIGIETIHRRVMCLTGWLIDNLCALRHSNGKPMLHIHGPCNTRLRGGTVTISFYDPDGAMLDDRRIEELANRENISLRTGCFCNPGAGEVAHGLDQSIMKSFFNQQQGMSFLELRCEMLGRYGKSISAVRISTGIVSNFADIYTFLRFITGFRDKKASEVGKAEGDQTCSVMERDSA